MQENFTRSGLKLLAERTLITGRNKTNRGTKKGKFEGGLKL